MSVTLFSNKCRLCVERVCAVGYKMHRGWCHRHGCTLTRVPGAVYIITDGQRGAALIVTVRSCRCHRLLLSLSDHHPTTGGSAKSAPVSISMSIGIKHKQRNRLAEKRGGCALPLALCGRVQNWTPIVWESAHVMVGAAPAQLSHQAPCMVAHVPGISIDARLEQSLADRRQSSVPR